MCALEYRKRGRRGWEGKEKKKRGRAEGGKNKEKREMERGGDKEGGCGRGKKREKKEMRESEGKVIKLEIAIFMIYLSLDLPLCYHLSLRPKI